MSITLGLDLGPNSIGWALLDESHIIATGVRVFPEGVDAFDTGKESSRNEQRRIARGMRRQTQRRNQRRKQLQQALIEAGLWPADHQKQSELYAINPYELRAKAVDEKLEPHEIGRMLLHLNQRRGFLSNRKKDRKDSEVKGMLAEISKLQKKIKNAGCITLGQYLYQQYQSFDHANQAMEQTDRIRNRHTQRSMLEDEFHVIWDKQAQHYPALLTDQLKFGKHGQDNYPVKKRTKNKDQTLLQAFGVHGMIFFQRTMFWPKSVIGLCELEPREKRCPRADRLYERFRLLSEINNLRLIDDTVTPPVERKLTEAERSYLLDQLQTKEKASFEQLAKWVSKVTHELPPENIRFNLQTGKRAGIKGMVTDVNMAKAVGKPWHKRPDDEKNAIVQLLLEVEHNEQNAIDTLINQYGFTAEQADEALCVDFADGYGHLSRKALRKLLPFMEQGMIYQGLDESNSALNAAGYLRHDQLRRRLFDKLPREGEYGCPLGDIPNPVVKRTLSELRKVVNCIIREYGKPDHVHLEMTRGVRMGTMARKEFNRNRAEREKQRNAAADAIARIRDEYKIRVKINRDSIIRYLIWEEQNHECIYTGKPISQRQLFTGVVDVDHILPRSRSLDDSQSNKVLCFREANHQKGQRTVYEWLDAADPARFEEISLRALSMVKNHGMHYGKYKKLMQKHVDVDNFIARQLTDTGYITRMTREYLACLFEQDKQILGLKGQHTATLRHQWGLDNILRQDDVQQKTREDHRHHAIDAIVVAVTNRSRLQQLSKGYQEVEKIDYETGEVQYQQAHTGPNLPEPWDNFREDIVQQVNDIKVSHRVNRKISGSLHNDTVYAPVKNADGNIEANTYVVRKSVANLSPNEIEKIRDHAIRQIVIKALANAGIEFGRGKKVDTKKMQTVLSDLRMPNKKQPDQPGVPIRKVRLLVQEQTIQPIRQKRAERADDPTQIAHVKPGNTHHACIFEWEEDGKTKRDSVFVTMLEAINRIKQQQQYVANLIKACQDIPRGRHARKKCYSQFYKDAAEKYPLIDRKHPTRKNAKFLMSLSNGECILCEYQGEEKLLILKTSTSTQNGKFRFAEHTDARRSSEIKPFSFNTNTLKGRKVTIDPLGRIRWAND